MVVKVILIVIGTYVALEIIEHLVLPLIWLLLGKRKQSVTGITGLVGEVAEVINWHNSKGRVFVHGEIWWAESDMPFGAGDKAVIHDVKGLTLRVGPLKT